jgi:ATP-dependent Clp protease ATP-binding subunit ClpC
VTDRTLSVIMAAASEEARSLKHGYLGAEHLFLALAARTGGTLLRGYGLDPGRITEAVRREVGTGRSEPQAKLEPSPRLETILALAAAKTASDQKTSEAHLLEALFLEGGSLPVRYLDSLGLSAARALERLAASPASGAADQTRLVGELDVPLPPRGPLPMAAPPPGPRIRPETAVPVSMPTPTLDECGRDITKLAQLGKVADATGRDAEIEQIITILARTQKSNPLLLGEAGVGKTAVVEGLAWRIVNGQVPPLLRGKRIVEIAMGGLVAGTELRGQFEEKIESILTEATAAPEVILFIDEIHTMMGTAAQMFKPALARGEISCIGATTQDEYARSIRTDPALERRFSPITIGELSREATLKVLESVTRRILEKHAALDRTLHVAPGALQQAILLTDKYLKDRRQPDKSIDAVDIACARAVVGGRLVVDTTDIAAVVSGWTGIPTAQLTRDEYARYVHMEADLSQRVVGQPEAVHAVSSAVRAALAGMKQPNRPIGVFLFIGPSGVGKTQLAKELATFLFDAAEALVRFDMNEYMEKHAVSNLLGAPRGYIGSESGGLFTEALRRRPYSVVLLDEIEKAHPDVLNLFLAVFDDGRITDNRGRVIDCSNAVFVLTSNLGLDRIESSDAKTPDLRGLAAQFLRPELVNRLTEVVKFAPLGTIELARILDRLLSEKTAVFQTAQGVNAVFDESVKKRILSTVFDRRMGARPLERAVQQTVVQPLVDAIFAGGISPGTVRVTIRENNVVFLQEGTA